jgi:divalent metal cation (Fe/Co/Zn/Cd) transporter
VVGPARPRPAGADRARGARDDARPDDDHPFGHTKAEYFASAVEGALILVAAFGIAATAIERLLHPQPLEHVGVGLAISVVASSINLGVARVLERSGAATGRSRSRPTRDT